MKIVIPLAGRDARYPEFFGTAKPLVPVGDTILIKHTFDTLGFDYEKDFSEIIFICHPDDDREYQLTEKLRQAFPFPNVTFHQLTGSTEGAACTVLTVKERINTDEPLIVYLADIIFTTAIPFASVIQLLAPEVDGLIPCFPSEHTKYSYAEVDGTQVRRVAEKEVISHHASAGLYYFKKGADFVRAAESMIQDDTKRVNNAFYICPVYNDLLTLDGGKHVEIYPVTYGKDLGALEEIKGLATQNA